MDSGLPKEGHQSIPITSLPHDPSDLEFRNDRILRQTSTVISLSCYISVVFVLFSVVIASVVFALSSTLTPDKKAFIATVGVAGIVGILLILWLSRKHPSTLLIFIPLSTYIAGTLTGLSIANV